MKETRETIEIINKDISLLIYDDHPDFRNIDERYKFLGEDHDLLEFEAIVQRISDGKFFSFIWFDAYNGINYHIDKNDITILTEVFETSKIITVYE